MEHVNRIPHKCHSIFFLHKFATLVSLNVPSGSLHSCTIELTVHPVCLVVPLPLDVLVGLGRHRHGELLVGPPGQGGLQHGGTAGQPGGGGGGGAQGRTGVWKRERVDMLNMLVKLAKNYYC